MGEDVGAGGRAREGRGGRGAAFGLIEASDELADPMAAGPR